MRLRRTVLTASAAALVAAGGTAFAATSPSQGAQGGFAPAATATVHPGVQTTSPGGICTSDFVFTDGRSTFLGQAAHCAGQGQATDTDGCTTPSFPLGSAVQVAGASKPGRLAYSSWIAMQRAHETDPSTCAYNDLSLIALDPADVARTNPSVPVFGGPVGLATGTRAGDQLYSYGSSPLRQGIAALSPKIGLSLGDDAGGWTTTAYTLTPGVPGDSGSGFLTADGRAVGTLSTLALAPLPLANGLGNLAKEIGYAATHGVPGLRLVPGDVPFTGSPLSLVGGIKTGSDLLPTGLFLPGL